MLANERASFEPYSEKFSIIAWKISCRNELGKVSESRLSHSLPFMHIEFYFDKSKLCVMENNNFRKKNQNFRVTSHSQKHKNQISNFHTKHNTGKETN